MIVTPFHPTITLGEFARIFDLLNMLLISTLFLIIDDSILYKCIQVAVFLALLWSFNNHDKAIKYMQNEIDQRQYYISDLCVQITELKQHKPVDTIFIDE